MAVGGPIGACSSGGEGEAHTENCDSEGSDVAHLISIYAVAEAVVPAFDAAFAVIPILDVLFGSNRGPEPRERWTV